MPRKKRAPKPIKERTEEELIRASMAAVTRRSKAARADVYSKAQDASEKQWNLLSYELGTDSREMVIRYVEFANQIQSGQGTLNKYETKKIWLSRVYFIRAIDMCMKGYNEFTSARRELLVTFGVTDEQIDEALEKANPKNIKVQIRI